MPVSRGWYSRGYLPHVDVAGRAQFISWRLADALPKEVIRIFRQELLSLPENEAILEFARRVEAFCDAGQGSCVLGQAPVARVVQEKIFGYDGKLFDLHAWTLMPNHVHLLLTPFPSVELRNLVKQLKGGSAYEANVVLRRTGRLWQRDYFDRLIRDEAHFDRVRQYIEWNPVKAKLCSDPSHWQWSSSSPDSWKRLEFLRAERGSSCASMRAEVPVEDDE